jgi:hypothetical protein
MPYLAGASPVIDIIMTKQAVPVKRKTQLIQGGKKGIPRNPLVIAAAPKPEKVEVSGSLRTACNEIPNKLPVRSVLLHFR